MRYPLCIFFGLLVFSTSVSAKLYNEFKVPEDAFSVDTHYFPIWTDGGIYATEDDGGIEIVPMTQTSRGFRLRTPSRLLVEDLMPNGNANTISIVDFASDPFGGYLLARLSFCDISGECQREGERLVVLNKLGRIDDSRGTSGIVDVSEHHCDAGAKLVNKDRGVALISSCGYVQNFLPDLNKEEAGLFEVVDVDEGDAWYVPSKQTYDWPSIDDEITPFESNHAILIESGNGISFSVFTYSYQWEFLSEKVVNFAFDGVRDRCYEVKGDSFGFVCQDDSSVNYKTLDDDNWIEYLPLPRPDQQYSIAKDSEINSEVEGYVPPKYEYKLLESSVTSNKTLVLSFLESYTVFDPVVQEYDTSYRLRIDNIESETAERRASSYHEADDKSDSFKFSVDPVGFNAFHLFLSGNAVRVGAYQQLNVDSQPRFLSVPGGALFTENERSQIIYAEDEETFPKDILLSVNEAPSWLTLTQEDGFAIAKSFPSHEDAGEYEFSVSASDGINESNDFGTSYNVSLTDFSVLVFDANLFDKIDLDEPFPLSQLVDALDEVSLVEDEELYLEVSRQNRSEEELSIELGELPSWLSWNEETNVLYGVPEQSDVGRSSVTFYAFDKYGEVDEESGHIVPREIVMPLRVIEVDESLEIVSSPSKDAIVGEVYSYKIVAKDEETPVDDISLRVPVLPNWLTFDEESKTISGLPTADNLGMNRVQIVAQDSAGFAVLQTYSINVSSLDEGSDESGGSMGWIVLFLMAAVGLRRR